MAGVVIARNFQFLAAWVDDGLKQGFHLVVCLVEVALDLFQAGEDSLHLLLLGFFPLAWLFLAQLLNKPLALLLQIVNLALQDCDLPTILIHLFYPLLVLLDSFAYFCYSILYCVSELVVQSLSLALEEFCCFLLVARPIVLHLFHDPFDFLEIAKEFFDW